MTTSNLLVVASRVAHLLGLPAVDSQVAHLPGLLAVVILVVPLAARHAAFPVVFPEARLARLAHLVPQAVAGPAQPVLLHLVLLVVVSLGSHTSFRNPLSPTTRLRLRNPRSSVARIPASWSLSSTPVAPALRLTRGDSPTPASELHSLVPSSPTMLCVGTVPCSMTSSAPSRSTRSSTLGTSSSRSSPHTLVSKTQWDASTCLEMLR